jgi:hypothetical protein
MYLVKIFSGTKCKQKNTYTYLFAYISFQMVTIIVVKYVRCAYITYKFGLIEELEMVESEDILLDDL